MGCRLSLSAHTLKLVGLVDGVAANLGRRPNEVSADSGLPSREAIFVAFSSDGARVITASTDKQLRIWDADSAALLATFIASPDGEWLVIAPEGFFAASRSGSDLVFAAVGLEFRRLDQAFRRPDLVREKLAGDPLGKVRDEARKLSLEVLAIGKARAVSALTCPLSCRNFASAKYPVPRDDRALGTGSRADALGRHDNEAMVPEIRICSSAASIRPSAGR